MSWHQRQGIKRAIRAGRPVIPAGHMVMITERGFMSWHGPFTDKASAETRAALLRSNGAAALYVDGTRPELTP